MTSMLALCLDSASDLSSGNEICTIWSSYPPRSGTCRMTTFVSLPPLITAWTCTSPYCVLSVVPVKVPFFAPDPVFAEEDADALLDGVGEEPVVVELLLLLVPLLSALPPSALVVVPRVLNDSSKPRPTAVSSSASTTFRMTFPV